MWIGTKSSVSPIGGRGSSPANIASNVSMPVRPSTWSGRTYPGVAASLARTAASSARQRATVSATLMDISFCQNTCIYNSCRYNIGNGRSSQAPGLYQSQAAPAKSRRNASLRRLRRSHRTEEHAILVAIARGGVGADSPVRFGTADAPGRFDPDAQPAAAGGARLVATGSG